MPDDGTVTAATGRGVQPEREQWQDRRSGPSYNIDGHPVRVSLGKCAECGSQTLVQHRDSLLGFAPERVETCLPCGTITTRHPYRQEATSDAP